MVIKTHIYALIENIILVISEIFLNYHILFRIKIVKNDFVIRYFSYLNMCGINFKQLKITDV